MDIGTIAAVVAVGLTMAGSLVATGVVMAKVNGIDRLVKILDDLTLSNKHQDVLLGRICERMGMSSHTKLYESGK